MSGTRTPEEIGRERGEAAGRVVGAVTGTLGAGWVGAKLGSSASGARNQMAREARKLRAAGSPAAARSVVARGKAIPKSTWFNRPQAQPWRVDRPSLGAGIKQAFNAPGVGIRDGAKAAFTSVRQGVGARIGQAASALASRVPRLGSKSKGALLLGGAMGAAHWMFGKGAEGEMRKRAGDGVITEAERQQRVNAAKARWEKAGRTVSAATREIEDAPPLDRNAMIQAMGYRGRDPNTVTIGPYRTTVEPSPAKKPWTGQQLGLGRDVRVQAQSMMSPVWRHNYQGDEWGFGREGPKQEGGGKTYLVMNRKPQKPKGMSEAEFIDIGRRANALANARREDIIAEGLGQKLIGEDGRDRLRNRKAQATIPEAKRGDKEAVRLAFNHARMLAMNDVGLVRVDPDFRLTPEAKEKLKGMERFMWRARRQISNTLRDDRSLAPVWSQIREEHGDLFRDGRLGPDGKPKRYFPYHAQMVKAWGQATMMKRTKGAPLSEAELEQRRKAARRSGYIGGAATGLLVGGAIGSGLRDATRIAERVAQKKVFRAADDFVAARKAGHRAAVEGISEVKRQAARPASRKRDLVPSRGETIVSPRLAEIMRRGEAADAAARAARTTHARWYGPLKAVSNPKMRAALQFGTPLVGAAIMSRVAANASESKVNADQARRVRRAAATAS